MLIKQNIERITQRYGRNRTYVLFGKDKEMKEIIEGILKELRVKYITENEVEKIESTNVVLYWNVTVRKAKIYEYNNGLAVGSLLKPNVIKRIMYGRNKFDIYRQKDYE